MSDLLWNFNKEHNPYPYLPELMGWGKLKFYGRNFATSLLDCVIETIFILNLRYKNKLRVNNYLGFI